MDFPLPLTEWQWIAFAVFLGLIVFLIWKFRLEQVVQYPLPNEEDLGIAMICLPQLGVPVNEGRITTARRYWQEIYAKEIASADEAHLKQVITLRDDVLSHYPLAQRVGRSKKLYIFDADPMDAKNHVRLPDRGGKTPVRWIGPVKDCESFKGDGEFEFISAKLTMESSPFTEDQRRHEGIVLEGMAYSRDAASNLARMKFLEDRVKTLEGRDEELNSKLSKVSSEKDELLTGASIHSLLSREPLKPSHAFGPVAKQWFGDWKQVVLAAVGYLVIAPLVISSFVANATPPTTNYLTIGITIVSFFAMPIGKKLFGRWL
jgi:hypothetical protein